MTNPLRFYAPDRAPGSDQTVIRVYRNDLPYAALWTYENPTNEYALWHGKITFTSDQCTGTKAQVQTWITNYHNRSY